MLKTTIVFLLVAVWQINALCNDINYRCCKKKENVVYVKDFNFTCPGNQVCNRNFVEPCEPCVDLVEACEKLYSCTADGKVQLAKYKFDCPANYECNPVHTAECQPCKLKTCKPEQINYECKKDNPRAIKFVGTDIEFNCPVGQKCNADKLYPCKGCIKDTAVSRTVFPNCDFGAILNPCRPGSAGSNYYFRCIWEILGYRLEVKHCSKKPTDLLCMWNSNIC